MRRFCFLFFFFLSSTVLAQDIWTIAIDPGHGGKDPGAIGHRLRLYEKNVTLSVAQELKKLLDKDPNFRAVLTRKGDYYIPVPQRSEIARKAKANYLISIHADSAKNVHARGASVWVLSTKRANSEMGRWLEDHEKRSELLGGAGSVLASHNEKYLNKTVLDLQFSHSQRVGYEIGELVLKNFKKITQLSRNVPQNASLGVLRSPDIPSILVETGFLSNHIEEKQLNSLSYRKKLAQVIYKSLVQYRQQQLAMKAKSAPTPASKQLVDSGIRYQVKRGENLSLIARKFKISVSDLQKFNRLKRSTLLVGQKLNIPRYETLEKTPTPLPTKAQGDPFAVLEFKPFLQDAPKNSPLPKIYKVQKGDTLFSIARQFNLSLLALKELNPSTKNGTIFEGQSLRLQ